MELRHSRHQVATAIRSKGADGHHLSRYSRSNWSAADEGQMGLMASIPWKSRDVLVEELTCVAPPCRHLLRPVENIIVRNSLAEFNVAGHRDRETPTMRTSTAICPPKQLRAASSCSTLPDLPVIVWHSTRHFPNNQIVHNNTRNLFAPAGHIVAAVRRAGTGRDHSGQSRRACVRQ